MKSFLLAALSVLLFGCTSFDSEQWENVIKPEMIAHKKYLKAMEEIPSEANHFDDTWIDAWKYINSYVVDSLDSYQNVNTIYEILEAKYGEHLLISTGPLRFISSMAALTIAETLVEKIDIIDIELDFPEYVKETEDRETYSVYCPNYNENYTLTINKKTGEYSYDLTPIQVIN